MDIKPKKNRTRSKRERFRTFAEAYLDAASSTTYLNVYQSALAAGYSNSYAGASAYKLLEKAGIQREIERIRFEKRGNPKIASADEVLEALTAQLRMLPNKLFHPETKALISPADMTDELAQAIAGYKVKERVMFAAAGADQPPETETTYEFKLVDRQKAAVELGRYHGLFEKDNKQQAPTAPQALVAFPTGTLTLDEWQQQAEIILARQAAEKSSRL